MWQKGLLSATHVTCTTWNEAHSLQPAMMERRASNRLCSACQLFEMQTPWFPKRADIARKWPSEKKAVKLPSV